MRCGHGLWVWVVVMGCDHGLLSWVVGNTEVNGTVDQ